MSHDPFIFPTPTTEELEGERIYWLNLNPYWFSIAQGRLDRIKTPELWEDFDAVEASMNQLFEPVLPVAELIGARVYLSADQSINSATGTTVQLDTSLYVQGMIFSGNTLTLDEYGVYSIKAVISYSTGGGYRGGEIRADGAMIAASAYGQSGIAQAAVTNYVPIHWEGELNAGTVISLLAIHQSTGAINARGGQTRTWLTVRKVGEI